MATVLICGDSTLDNGPYVEAGGRPFFDHLEEALAGAYRVDFRALDGAVIGDVTTGQLPRPEDEAAYDALVVSVGGNDALRHAELLQGREARPLMETALMLRGLQEPFRADYRRMLEAARGLAPRILAFVTYRGCFSLDPHAPAGFEEAGNTLLSLFTDVQAEEARRCGADVLDLRTLFTDPALYANPIEPNDAGGRTIATAVAGWLTTHRLP